MLLGIQARCKASFTSRARRMRYYLYAPLATHHIVCFTKIDHRAQLAVSRTRVAAILSDRVLSQRSDQALLRTCRNHAPEVPVPCSRESSRDCQVMRIKSVEASANPQNSKAANRTVPLSACTLSLCLHLICREFRRPEYSASANIFKSA